MFLIGILLVIAWILLLFLPGPMIIFMFCYLLQKLFGVRWWITIFPVAALLAMPPLWINDELDARAKAYVSTDFDRANNLTKINVMAVREHNAGREYAADATCRNDCVLALFGGQIQEYLIIESETFNIQTMVNSEFSSFKIEKKSQCPKANVDSIFLRSMKTWVLDGRCIIQGRSKLQTADAVISVGPVGDGISEYDAGLDLNAFTDQADRLEMYIKDDNEYKVVHRRTTVATRKLIAFVIPMLKESIYRPTKLGYFRYTQLTNAELKRYSAPDLLDFMHKKLNFKLPKNS